MVVPFVAQLPTQPDRNYSATFWATNQAQELRLSTEKKKKMTNFLNMPVDELLDTAQTGCTGEQEDTLGVGA